MTGTLPALTRSMLTVYLKSGTVAVLFQAVEVQFQPFERRAPGFEVRGLVCVNDRGVVVARFALDEVAGYAYGEEVG